MGGFSLEVWDVGGLGEDEGDVGDSVGGGTPGSAQVERQINLGVGFLTA